MENNGQKNYHWERIYARINSKWSRDPEVKREMEGRVGGKEKGQGGAGAAPVLEANKVSPFINGVWGKLRLWLKI